VARDVVTAGDPDAARLRISVLQEAGAIRDCEEHDWMQDRADPHAGERVFDVARENPAAGVSSQTAAVAIRRSPGRDRPATPIL
jgi:hypothetical protein